ncbi:ABC transporter ATP-binding protein [Paenibacillus glucanolyticus]|jgi:spermidine/putrescine transport system ATP-binding protein|uniref:Spermidine/putrescine ABC transporter ATP-binding protein n=1 Tax=Paenibacillus glucanolyticus TaxID=59843 RepID=A0A163J614_9BACL|nr:MULTISPECIES: ABC transporter ATP-binding protein [Paenibacillus]ANA80370.1 spermidine/putrescine ABC transporter ATP-binding protein [Paenibacillus glucanolyticus]AVV55561.1 ABC transporter ATP-binding protein [Paenibacillus glucanolyticus]ETT30576.1 spermidine/putrescine ABC transporter ATP-binding protein [Paenibacillus sp. FSL R5-808]KZS46387.1 spermidine/putrescine ABC transporter ATP-binding protein [Paenibacillus glucanolyticus]MDH6671154.1 spermidine/putrescine transport system ATP-
MHVIELVQIEKHFQGQAVVHPLSLSIKEGEFLTLLGPSGCGKTTILRMIAGFEQPTEGQVLLAGQNVTDVPANKRDLNLVFQHYALFPHMTVEDNIAFGLKMKKMPRQLIKERVDEAVTMTQLTPLRERFPHQLSGGQQQRVAIARAIANKPKVLLLDEPLGALDLQLRKNLQSELKHLQRTLGITFVYVTHDQEEAMMLSDRIVIMNHGRVEQIGTPREIYARPQTLFAATFVGENNVFSSPEGLFAVRPEKLVPQRESGAKKSGVIEDVQYLGSVHKLLVQLDNEPMKVTIALDISDDRPWEVGERVGVNWSTKDEVIIGP